MKWLLNLWYARCRKLDLQILWPQCYELAHGDLTKARAAFAVHAYNDPAWQYLGQRELYNFIDNLTASPHV